MAVTAVERAPKNYSTLLTEVRGVLEAGRARAREAVDEEKVRTYWGIGRLVNEHLRLHKGRAGYGEKVVNQLAEDLGISQRTLYNIVEFQQAFPILQTFAKLSWSQCILLSHVEDSKQRQRLLREAVQKNLSARELAAKIGPKKPLLLEDEKKSSSQPARGVRKSRELPPLVPVRGNFYTYQIVKPRNLHTLPEFYAVDLGFGSRVDLKLPGVIRPREGQMIEAVRTEENQAGDRYHFKKSPAGKEALYTFKAAVKKVIDDDTLWADVDLGFRFWVEKKLRLRGINAPEVHDKKKMSRFVAETLARVSFVVVKLHGRDKFDRRLADLFYLEGEENAEKVLREGIYLNQELLDRGLAVRYEGD